MGKYFYTYKAYQEPYSNEFKKHEISIFKSDVVFVRGVSRKRFWEIGRVVFQSDLDKRFAFQAYGGRVEFSENNISAMIPILQAMKKAGNTWYLNNFMKMLKGMKAERLTYHQESHSHIPYAFRRNPDIWVTANENGLSLSRRRAA